MRACLVSCPSPDLGAEGGDRLRDAGLAGFRAAERVAVFSLELGLVMRSLRFARRHPPHHLKPRSGKSAGQGGTQCSLRRFKSPQQCSDQARKPVNSEQDCCS
jgi:hypothetical protein